MKAFLQPSSRPSRKRSINNVEWQKEKLGRDINPSQLMKNIIEAGAKRAEITEPVFTKVENTEVAVADQISVAMGGIESE